MEGEDGFDEEDQEGIIGDESDWVWESEDGESTFESDDSPPWLRNPIELQTRDEFLVLQLLIKKKDEKKNPSK